MGIILIEEIIRRQHSLCRIEPVPSYLLLKSDSFPKFRFLILAGRGQFFKNPSNRLIFFMPVYLHPKTATIIRNNFILSQTFGETHISNHFSSLFRDIGDNISDMEA